MPTVNIRGIPVNFPFQPYDIQTVYMEKVIECLQNEQNGVLESPTGTGKTLSLLCSSLAWLTMKKAQIQAQRQAAILPNECEYLDKINSELGAPTSSNTARTNFAVMPTIIYASRTHSQLTQVMQELKRSAYNYVRSTVIGSRDQMCLHPEISKEPNQVKIQLCKMKVKDRSCTFYNKVESRKKHPDIMQKNIMDIEDLVTEGKKQGFCPYFMAKELKQQCDIVFMPYNYILDARARKALGIELSNNVIILDEAHNIEKICEDSASIEIKSTDITLAIDEVTAIMKGLSKENLSFDEDTPLDFSAEELCVLKEIFLKFERVIDAIEVNKSSELTSFNGEYIFELLADAGITDANAPILIILLDRLTNFLATAREGGPFQRKGNGLQLFEDFLRIVFASLTPDFKEKLKKCYKVNVSVEDTKKRTSMNPWISRAAGPSTCKVLSFWCFSPGFGMNILKAEGIRCIILTSGTLAPLAPLITELELNVKVCLENPHIVKHDQICVNIIPRGPDGEPLTSTFRNRDNLNYVKSLGNAILNITRMVPNGLLIFFPSYTTLQKCQDTWQQHGIWSNIVKFKPIFVEPKEKEAFQTAMQDYYSKVRDPQYKGAIFMGVCRGKVSEGLDFADYNGRAVIITGLPYPPLKDPKVVLKKRYLNERNKEDKNFLIGDDWYGLEATKAVNQAIGRVIRHRHDYGAILLLDSRFSNHKVQSQLSMWLRGHIKLVNNFGEIIRHLFDELAAKVQAEARIEEKPSVDVDATIFNYNRGLISISGVSSSSSSANESAPTSVAVHRSRRKKIKVQWQPAPTPSLSNSEASEDDLKQIVVTMKKNLKPGDFQIFARAIQTYRDSSNLRDLTNGLNMIFLANHPQRYLIQMLFPCIKRSQQSEFQSYWELMK